jgi:4a-hydroxytetrahydrobiopterin dehydratase
MQIVPAEVLVSRKCLPCEGGIEPCSLDYSTDQLKQVPNWHLEQDNRWIARSLRFGNFVQTLECLNRIGELAEAEAHHPDFHVTGYRHLKIAITTHAIGGLSENDFILAAKINAIVSSEFPKAKNND